MASKRVETLEEEFGEFKMGLEERLSNLESMKGDVVSMGGEVKELGGEMKNRFAAMEGMIKKMMEIQARGGMGVPVADPKGKGVQNDDDESVYYQEPIPRDLEGGGMGGQEKGTARTHFSNGGGGAAEHNWRPYRQGEHGADQWGPNRTQGEGYSGGRGFGGDRDPRVRKLKMSVFEGEDAHGWIYRVERYFAVNGLTEGERLTAAALCLEGKALSWFQWRDMRDPIRSWEEFKDCLLERFRSSREGDFSEQFFALVQEGKVVEYRERFEYLSSRVGRLSDTILEGNS